MKWQKQDTRKRKEKNPRELRVYEVQQENEIYSFKRKLLTQMQNVAFHCLLSTLQQLNVKYINIWIANV